MPSQLARELDERNRVVAAAENDKRNRWLPYFQQHLRVAPWQLISPRCASMRPERLPSIVFDASGKLRIPDVIPKLAIAPEEKA
jgi:hypothetical protein